MASNSNRHFAPINQKPLYRNLEGPIDHTCYLIKILPLILKLATFR